MKKGYFIILLLLILSMTGCIGKEKIIENPIVEYICPTGYDLVNNKCVDTTSLLASIRSVCPQGYYLTGTKCAKNGTFLYATECGFDKTYQNGYCYPTLFPTTEYYCVTGKLVGTYCVTEKYEDPKPYYRCRQGFYLNENNECQSNN